MVSRDHRLDRLAVLESHVQSVGMFSFFLGSLFTVVLLLFSLFTPRSEEPMLFLGIAACGVLYLIVALTYVVMMFVRTRIARASRISQAHQ